MSALAGLPAQYAAITLIITAAMALMAKANTNHWAIALVVPQQIVLFLQAYGAFGAILHGQYPDGYVPIPESMASSRWFINGDQILTLILAVWHTIEMSLMGFYALKDKKEADELLDLRRRVASYEEAGKWKSLIEDMTFFDPSRPRRRKK